MIRLLSSVQLLGELALLTSSGVLVQDTLGNTLIDGLDSSLISGINAFVGDDSSFKLLDHGLHLSLSSAIHRVVDLANQDTLLSRLNVGHDSDLPYSEFTAKVFYHPYRKKASANLHIFLISAETNKNYQFGGIFMEQRRTDLAMERLSGLGKGPVPGIAAEEWRQEPLSVHRVTVLDRRGEQALDRPVGQYLTAQLDRDAIWDSRWMWESKKYAN